MDEPDLRAPRLRVLECTACTQPVWTEPVGSRLTLRCGYCGREDVRELAPQTAPPTTDEAYRGPRWRGGSRRLSTDLARPPGMARVARVPQLRAQLTEAYARLAPLDADADERPDAEHRVVYCAATLAMAYLHTHDHLRARATLETALESLHEPVYRAMVLARLARLAAFGDAPELAERWLSLVPEGLRVAEVACDLRTVRAALARARNDPDAMLEALGPEDSSVGASRPLAMGLRADALERLGKTREARRVYRKGSRGGALAFGAMINAFSLAPKTRRRTIAVGLAAIGLIVLALGSLGLLAHGDLLGAVALLAFALVGTIFLKLF